MTFCRSVTRALRAAGSSLYFVCTSCCPLLLLLPALTCRKLLTLSHLSRLLTMLYLRLVTARVCMQVQGAADGSQKRWSGGTPTP